MYCRFCGKEIEEGSAFCSYCGRAQQGDAGGNGVPPPPYGAPPPHPAEKDAPSGGFAVLGFFFPLIGLILYLVWKNELPLRARSCGKGALIGVIVQAVGFLLSFVAFFVLMNYLILVI